AYYDEFTDDNLIARHEKELFPLTKKRYLFSQVDNFELYDFIDPHGNSNENVFAFTNRSGNEVSLVIYNNSYSEAFGAINYSCERAFGEEGRTTTTTIDKALNIDFGNGFYYIFKDYIQQLEFIISGSQLSSAGFSFHLNGYQRKVLLDFREVYDADGRLKILHNQLNGRGVDSIERALSELNLAPFHNSLVHLFTSIKFSRLLLALDISNKDEIEIPIVDEEVSRIINNLSKIKSPNVSQPELINQIQSDISQISDFNNSFLEIASSKRPAKWIGEVKSILYPEKDSERKKILSFLLLNRVLFRILNSVEKTNLDYKVFDELLLWKPLFEIYGFLRYDDPGRSYELSKILFDSDYSFTENTDRYFIKIFEKDITASFVQINEYENVKYFNKERIEELIKWQFIISCSNLISINAVRGNVAKKTFNDSLKIAFARYSEILQRILKSEYKIDNLVSIPEVKIIKKVKAVKKTSIKKITPKKKAVSKIDPKKIEKETTKDKQKKKVMVKKTKTKKKAKS
ncbi:MAG: hypothetical protein Q8M94_12470, partial [Ignavibacteria bacterium]|nr:hypothetical protein [Ignavibacteria bacterium]